MSSSRNERLRRRKEARKWNRSRDPFSRSAPAISQGLLAIAAMYLARRLNYRAITRRHRRSN